MNIRTLAIALMCAATTAGCSDEALNRTVAVLTGELQALTTDKATLQARLDSEPALTDAQRQALQSRLDAVEDRLATLKVEPVTPVPYPVVPVAVTPEPPPAPPPPKVLTWADMACRPVFRGPSNPCGLEGEYDYNAYSSAN